MTCKITTYSDAIPDGLAVDMYSSVVYYTDTGLDVIMSLNYDGSNEKLLVSISLDQPRSIVLRMASR